MEVSPEHTKKIWMSCSLLPFIQLYLRETYLNTSEHTAIFRESHGQVPDNTFPSQICKSDWSLAPKNLSTFSRHQSWEPSCLPKQSLSHKNFWMKTLLSIWPGSECFFFAGCSRWVPAQCAHCENCKRNMVYQLELISHNIQYPVLSSASIFSQLRQEHLWLCCAIIGSEPS